MSPHIESCLRSHQLKPAAHLLQVLGRFNSAVDFSDTGTGKTYVACAVFSALQLPTLVVCPKIAITAWHRAAEVFGEKFSVINYEKLRIGNTPFGRWSNPPPREALDPDAEQAYKCQCCQQNVFLKPSPLWRPCYCHPLGIHCIETKKKPRWNCGSFKFHDGVRGIIFDEVHRCGGLHSLNSELLIGATRQRISTLSLSATPANSPLALRALGYSLGLHSLTPAGGGLGFYDWARAFGVRRDPNFKGLHWFASEARQAEVMRDIHGRIFPARGVRVRCDEIPGFPAIDIQCNEYDLEEHGEIIRLYSEMDASLRLLEQTSRNDADPEHPLTKILRARQRIELLKVPIAVELCNDALATGRSVAIFANFRATLDTLSERLKTRAIIDGSPDGVKHRQKHIDDFQADESRIVLCNSEAGGISVSLHDLWGNRPRLAVVFPGWSATTMRQVFGRLRRDGGKSTAHYKVIFAANSPDVPIARALRAKSNNLDALNDADLMPENFRLHKTPLLRTIR